jgi:hypothetical protein
MHGLTWGDLPLSDDEIESLKMSGVFGNTCKDCFGDGWQTNGSAGLDGPPGSRTWCPTCFGCGRVDGDI